MPNTREHGYDKISFARGTDAEVRANVEKLEPYEPVIATDTGKFMFKDETGSLKSFSIGGDTQVDLDKKLDKGGFTGTAQDLQNGIDGKLGLSGGSITGGVRVINATGPVPEYHTGQLELSSHGAGQAASLGFHNPGLNAHTLQLEPGWIGLKVKAQGGGIGNLQANLVDAHGNLVYSAANKPTAVDVGALPNPGYGGLHEMGRYIDLHHSADPNVDYSTRLEGGGDHSFVVWNPYGNIEIGPKNGGHCHIYTNMPNFYMNKHLQINGANVLVDGGQHGTLTLSNWIRTLGDCGWHSESYGGGIHMTDATWIRTYGHKAIHCSNDITSAGNIIAFYSDERMKKDFTEIPSVLDKIAEIKPYHYVQSELATKLGYKDEDKVQIGFKAGDIADVFPEFIQTAPVNHSNDIPDDLKEEIERDPIKTLDYGRMVTVLWKGIQELKAEIDSLKARLGD